MYFFQSNDQKYPISSSLEDLLAKTNQANERKQLTCSMKAISKTSIDCTSKKSSTHEINLSMEDVLKTQSMCRKPSAIRSPNLKSTAGTSRSEDNLDLNRSPTNIAPQYKKRVNILTSVDHPSSKQKLCSSTISIENADSPDDSNEANPLNSKSSSLARIRSPDNYLTMTGTIKRGKKKGQSLDVQLNISRDELEKINNTALMIRQEHENAKKSCCMCSLASGVHILLLSILSLPFVVIITSIYSFYMGTLTWYNMFNYFNEEKSYLHKLVMSPLLVIAYPIGIVLCTIGLAIYSGIVQISTRFVKWSNEIADIEKGFYGWLCNFLHLSDCSPYEVVILTDLKVPDEAVPANSSTEELSI